MKVTHISVTFAGKIPTGQYANVDVGASWSADLEAGDNPEQATAELFGRIRDEVSRAVLPIAQAKVAQSQTVIRSLPPKERDEFMAKMGAVQWLSAVVPETAFAADDLLQNRIAELEQANAGLNGQLRALWVGEDHA